MVNTDASYEILAPRHDFTSVSSEDCIKCHGPDAHKLLPAPDQVTDARVLAMANSVPELTTKLETTQQSNKVLQIMAPVSLGLGIGIGGMLGIAFMLVVGYINGIYHILEQVDIRLAQHDAMAGHKICAQHTQLG